jgi:plasmid stability protein
MVLNRQLNSLRVSLTVRKIQDQLTAQVRFRASKDKNHELNYWENRALLPTVAEKMRMHFSLAAPIQNNNDKIVMLL